MTEAQFVEFLALQFQQRSFTFDEMLRVASEGGDLGLQMFKTEMLRRAGEGLLTDQERAFLFEAITA